MPTLVEGPAASAASPSTGTTRRTCRAASSRWVSPGSGGQGGEHPGRALRRRSRPSRHALGALSSQHPAVLTSPRDALRNYRGAASVVRRRVEAAASAPPCVRLSASLGATRKMEIAPVIDPNESRDELLWDLPGDGRDVHRVFDSGPSRRFASEPPSRPRSSPSGAGWICPRRWPRRVTAMGGRLIRLRRAGDVRRLPSFTVPLLRTSRDERVRLQSPSCRFPLDERWGRCSFGRGARSEPAPCPPTTSNTSRRR